MPIVSPQIPQAKEFREQLINWISKFLPEGSLPPVPSVPDLPPWIQNLMPPTGNPKAAPMGFMPTTEPGNWQGAGQRVVQMAIPQPEDTLFGLMNPWYHGTHKELVDIINKEGFKPSQKGTAGPGLYLADSPQNALYERNPALSNSVKAMGKQPDATIPVDIQGNLFDAGLYGRKNGPSPYLQPHQWAAYELYGDSIPFQEIFNNSPELLKNKGYVGVQWSWPDKRKSAVVFNPKDAIITK